MRDSESGGNRKERPGKDLQVVWACDAKRLHYAGRRAMEMKAQGRRNRGRPKRRWLDKVNDDIKEK